MNVLDSSLAYRTGAWIVARFATVSRDSLVGRFFTNFGRKVGLAGSAGVTFGLSRVRVKRLARTGHPASVLLISRPYLWLRAGLAPAAARGRTRVTDSRFASGAWLTILGAGVFALGCGLLGAHCLESASPGADVSGFATGAGFALPALLAVIGGLVALCGPRLMPAVSSSVVGRFTRWVAAAVVEGSLADAVGPGRGGAGAEQASPTTGRWSPVLGLGMVLAVAAGLAGGFSAGSGAVLVAVAGAVVILAALILHRPEVFLLVGAAFPWVDWSARHALGGLGPAWDDAFLLLSVVLLVWAVLFLRRAELWTVPVLLPILLALAAAVGSVVFNRVPGEVAVFALRVLFQPLLFYFLGYLFPKNRRWVQWTVAVFVLAGVALALHGVFQYVTHAPMPKSWVDVHEGDIGTRAYSIVENPNGLGAFLLLGVLLSLSIALRSGLRASQRWVMAVACAVQLAGLAVTFSRGAWIGLAAGVIVLFIVSYRRFLVPLAAVGVLGWFLVPARFTSRLTFAFSSTYLAKSLAAGRLYVWGIALSDVVRHPLFGVGLGTFGGTAAVTFGYSRLWVDNFYLQLAAEGGLLLLGLFLWVLLRTFKGVVNRYLSARDPYARALTAGVFGGLVAVAAANLTASVWETLVVGVGFWFMAGLATSASLATPSDAQAEDSI